MHRLRGARFLHDHRRPATLGRARRRCTGFPRPSGVRRLARRDLHRAQSGPWSPQACARQSRRVPAGRAWLVVAWSGRSSWRCAVKLLAKASTSVEDLHHPAGRWQSGRVETKWKFQPVRQPVSWGWAWARQSCAECCGRCGQRARSDRGWSAWFLAHTTKCRPRVW